VFRYLFHILGSLLAVVTGIGLLARFIPPDVLWPPTVIALLLPALLALLLLYVLVIAWKKRWRVLVFPAAVLLFSLSVAGRVFSFGTGAVPDVSGAQTLIVVTNNVRGFRDEANANLEEEWIDLFVERLNADVLLLQEVRRKTKEKSKFSGVIRSAGNFSGYDQPENRTVATYAGSVKNVASSFKGYNGYLVSDVETELGTIRFVNAHLQSNRISGLASQIGKDRDVEQEINRAESMFRRYGITARKRAAQAEDIRLFIEDSPHPVVVAGDFNDVPSSYTYQRLLTPRLRDAWVAAGLGLGTTFTGPLPGLRIDFILVDTSLSVVEIERIETGFSDHRALRAVLK